MSAMQRFLLEFFGGLALIAIGVIVSIASEQYLFYGIMIVGLVMMVNAVIKYFKNRKKDNTTLSLVEENIEIESKSPIE